MTSPPSLAANERGMTLVELLVVLVVIVVVLGLAMPSFNNMLARKRVEGVHTELQTDVQLARSEAVSRSRPVRVTFGAGCYLVHTHPVGAGASSCTQGAASTIDANATEIKTMQLAAGTTATLAPLNSLNYVEFDPVRGTATWDGGGATGAVNINSTMGTWQLQVNTLATGRVQTCSPSGSMTGFTPCHETQIWTRAAHSASRRSIAGRIACRRRGRLVHRRWGNEAAGGLPNRQSPTAH